MFFFSFLPLTQKFTVFFLLCAFFITQLFRNYSTRLIDCGSKINKHTVSSYNKHTLFYFLFYGTVFNRSHHTNEIINILNDYTRITRFHFSSKAVDVWRILPNTHVARVKMPAVTSRITTKHQLTSAGGNNIVAPKTDFSIFALFISLARHLWVGKFSKTCLEV